MSGSLSDWLALREPADVAARSQVLTERLAAWLTRRREARAGGKIRVLDLASGTGSNVRSLADRLPLSQEWLLIDREIGLLSQVPGKMAAWAAARGLEAIAGPNGVRIAGRGVDCSIETKALNLGVLDHDDLFAVRDLVTASALLDLVSERWLRAVAAHCRANGAAALFTLTYDGRSSCDPEEPEDDEVRDLMNRHQKTDKGLGGPAEGPSASVCADRCFVEAGYVVQRVASDWHLNPEQAAMQRTLIEGWAEAAIELAPDKAPVVRRWLSRRLTHVERGRSRITVGHEDLLAWPASTIEE